MRIEKKALTHVDDYPYFALEFVRIPSILYLCGQRITDGKIGELTFGWIFASRLNSIASNACKSMVVCTMKEHVNSVENDQLPSEKDWVDFILGMTLNASDGYCSAYVVLIHEEDFEPGFVHFGSVIQQLHKMRRAFSRVFAAP